MAVSFQRLAAVFLGGLLGAAGAFLLCGKSTFPTGGELTEGIPVPGIMYHNVLPDGSEGLGEYVVSASELEGDLQLLKEAGYEGVTPEELFNFVRGVGTLPEKPVLLTFDDGFESVRELAWPLLKERKMKAVLSVVGSITETYAENADRNINYAYLNWDDIRELSESEEFEIQNHTYDMHSTNNSGRKGLSRKSGESPVDYENFLKEDLSRMQNLLKKLSGVSATAVAYPYGSYSKETLGIVKELGFRSSFLCEERINRITRSNADSLFDLGRYNRPSGRSTEDFFEKLLKRG